MSTASIPIHPLKKPIHPINFADLMKKRIKSLNSGFYCGGKIRDGFIQFCLVYNDCIDSNSKGKLTLFVIPAATGSGKSVSATKYLSLIAKLGMSGLLVVSEVSVAIEAAKTINKLAGEEVAGVYHSLSDKHPQHKLWHPVNDLPRITIITHAMFTQRSYSGYNIKALRSFRGKQRDIIIIDERIDLIKRVNFGTNEIVDAVGILKRDDRLHGYAKILSDFNENIFKTKTNVVNRNVGVLKDFHDYLGNNLLVLFNNLDAGHYNLLQRLRGKKRNSASDRANVKDLFNRIIYVTAKNYTHIVEGSNVVCHREENLSGMFGSVVVLDATSQVNPEYDYRAVNGDDIIMFNRIASRNYSNVTLNICSFNGPNQSRWAIYHKPKRENKLKNIILAYLKVIGAILKPGDNLLVATYMDVVQLFIEHNPYKDQVKFIYWGSKDARGSNAFKDCNKAIVIGWHRRPFHYYVSTVMAINQMIGHYISTTGSVSSDATHLENMLIVDDMIQFFNRVRCRTAIDNKGNCPIVELYCFTGGKTKMEEVIRTSIVSEMPNTVIIDWKPKELKVLKRKATKNEQRAKNIVMWLRGRIEKYEEIPLAELRQEFGFKLYTVSKVINSEIFKDLLEEEGITMITEKRSGNPVKFIFPDSKV
jgi:hypothetical protein